MADHFGRPAGAKRKSGKKGASKGSGGKGRGRLEGRKNIPKAEDRPYHPAHKRKLAAQARAAQASAAAPKLRASLRLKEGHELVVGRNPVAEAVAAGVPYSRVFMVGALAHDERVISVARAASAAGVPIAEVSRAELDLLADGASHQGIALEMLPYEYVGARDLVERAQEHAERPGLIVALDAVTDPHNLGAAIRSASAFRADGVLITARRSASVNATVWKVSAGAVARVPVARETNLVLTLKELKKQGYFVVGLAGEADAVPIAHIPLADMPLVLVTGSEGAGLSRLVRETCDAIAAIPIASEMESLNAAVATGIALYQVDQLRSR
ncbi:MAG: 23S rRNA (guanosine(2251)-2'-O)-methyltransferase RlmB [Actinomycetaceae bacterium]|nr:23S rRNA (guanosine(2251)-2'-O)-methyltransferase RlmB [Arcanobacterium sp.]MDD7687202.1 23S rRNA (guanosine(2251)-2'-O)-methyltransferase RlmB [Actinomycetaceae bacterium]MDY5273501.1 23S rRNA (guanosine(2251)-2'-O)-methyltransferase RlmB [Arcanobacterium sp.]